MGASTAAPRARRRAPQSAERGAPVYPGVELAPGFLPARTVVHALVQASAKVVDGALAAALARGGEPEAHLFARLAAIAGHEPRPLLCLSELLDGVVEQVVVVRAVETGELEVVFSEPWLDGGTPALSRFLEAVNGRAPCTLSGTGWHYHYCNQLGQRSDVRLCLDPDGAHPSPVFWERSASAKACFVAEVPSWRKRKRESVIAVCQADAKGRDLGAFRPPTAGAKALAP